MIGLAFRSRFKSGMWWVLAKHQPRDVKFHRELSCSGFMTFEAILSVRPHLDGSFTGNTAPWTCLIWEIVKSALDCDGPRIYGDFEAVLVLCRL